MNRNLGLVVFGNHSGLGNQSRRLTEFLRPERILYIDNSPFSRNAEQHPEWYQGFSGYQVKGFPSRMACIKLCQGLTHLYVIENPLNWDLIDIARYQGVKVYIATNYEFCDNLIHPEYQLPDKFLMPSYWKIKEMQDKFGKERVMYLPPPLFPNDFKTVRELNFRREGKKRFLHIVGTLAVADRNGTLLLLESLKHTKSDFELVIKSQHELPRSYLDTDKRIRYEFGSVKNESELYKDFDAMILPRRFGGLCLPMQEALISGLPVVMPDISPNQELLKKEWLMSAKIFDSIITRTAIDLYTVEPKQIAKKIDELCKKDLEKDKIDAFEIAYNEFSPAVLEERYNNLW